VFDVALFLDNKVSGKTSFEVVFLPFIFGRFAAFIRVYAAIRHVW
tara:strand:+ start:344 stop:478 length:135 start_codon:yes stop_codon:yes gene_type:complete